jgi:hypothetical protein
VRRAVLWDLDGTVAVSSMAALPSGVFEKLLRATASEGGAQ